MLRAEKGYIIVGQETDGTVTPDDLGLGWTIGRAKRDFVGKRSLSRPDMLRADRKQLVGLTTIRRRWKKARRWSLTRAPDFPCLRLGTSRRRIGARRCTARSHWRCWLVAGRIGRSLYVAGRAGAVVVRVTEPMFYDAQGVRLMGERDLPLHAIVADCCTLHRGVC